MADNQDDSFNAAKAEVFEALGHPTRIRLLQTLSEKPLPFTELKRSAGLESNGLLTFHLGKLSGLVRLNPEGAYALTDEGREALRIIEASRTSKAEPRSPRPAFHLPQQKAVLAGLVVIMIVLGSMAVYQQERINSLSQEVALKAVSLAGEQYYYVTLPLTAVIAARTIIFDGVNFTATILNYGSSSVPISAALNRLFYSAPCVAAHTCEAALDEFPDFIVSFGAGSNESFSPSMAMLKPLTCKLASITPTASVTIETQISVVCSFVPWPSYNLWISQGIWLSQHTQPQAGIRFDGQNATLTFYVSSS